MPRHSKRGLTLVTGTPMDGAGLQTQSGMGQGSLHSQEGGLGRVSCQGKGLLGKLRTAEPAGLDTG